MASWTSRLHWLPAIAWAVFIFTFSNQTSPPGALIIPDFVAHFIVYGILGVTLVRGRTEGWKYGLTPRSAFILWLVACLYAVSDEFHQSYIPGRDASVRDLLFDFLGAGAAIWALLKLVDKRPSRNSSP